MTHKGTIVLESQRLLLRKFKIDDAPQMHKNFFSDSEVVKFLSWEIHNDEEQSLETIKNICNNYKNNYYHWAVESKETNELVGYVAVFAIDENTPKTCEVGYSLAKKYWNNSIGTESMQIVFNYLFNNIGFEQINSYYLVGNEISKKVMDKLNMRYMGEIQNTYKNKKGEYVLAGHYNITKEEFNSINIRKAYQHEVNSVGEIYENIITHLENNTNFCGWKHGIYPTIDVAKTSYSKGELFVAVQSGFVIGSCVLNHIQAKQYQGIDWKIKDDKPLVVHTVAINPNNLRQGIAHMLLEFSKEYAKENNILTIRLDASEPNIPARKIYEDVGFIKRGEMDLETNRCGINNWFGYEFII